MIYMKNVTTIQIDTAKCTGCTICTMVCPSQVFEMNNKKAAIKNRDLCIECGACAKNCAFDALSVDAGVGCAAAMINGLRKFGDPDKGTCDCSSESASGGGACC